MMNSVQVEELLKALEKVRAEKYTNIPTEIIKDIVTTQFENQDNPEHGNRVTKKIIDDFMKNVNLDDQKMG